MGKLTPEQAKSMATIFDEGVVEWGAECSTGAPCLNGYTVRINFVYEWNAEEQFEEMVKAGWAFGEDDGWLCPACSRPSGGE